MTPAELKAKVLEERSPAIHLIASDASSFSKLGGSPNLPHGTVWPRWGEAPLAFIAQLDLSELPSPSPLAELPTSGVLYFFYEQERSPWGFDPEDRGAWKVLYNPTRPSAAETEAPADLNTDWIANPVPLSFRPINTLPHRDRLQIPDWSYEMVDEFGDWLDEERLRPFAKRPHHQIGGFPDPVQNDSMELESQLVSNGLNCGDETGYNDPRAAALTEGAADWVLLLQVDTDDDAGMMWGDCGLIYFWIRREDLARRDFDNVWMILQCS